MMTVQVEPYGIPNDKELEEESENDQQSLGSALINIDKGFDSESFKMRAEPLMSKSAPDLVKLSETAIERTLKDKADQDIEDLVQKNTESFRCLAQALISRSSIMKHILYNFPELENPGIDEAFNYVGPELAHDNIGISRYKQLCKDMNIGPISRVIRSLKTDTLNLKYYGLSEKQFKAIAICIMFNTYIKYLIFEDNWITSEAALWLCEMLRENDSIKALNLRECRLGIEGMTNCIDGFSLNQSIKEIDLSYNDLGNVGIQIFTEALRDNFNVDKLNLSHNNLGEPAGQVLGELLKEHNNIDYLDLGWNDLYDGKALTYLFAGIMASDGLEYLNLTWNGLCSPELIAPIVEHLKRTQKLQHLDLSFNGIKSKSIMILSAALKANKSLKSINLGFNLITPAEAIKFISFLTPGHQLQYLDLQNIFVNKDFVPIWKQLTDAGKSIRIEGVLNDYTIFEPDRKKVAFDRCRYLAQKQKKTKKDFGSDFIWNLPSDIVDNDMMIKLVKKSKIKLDKDLIEFLGETFRQKKKKIDLKLMRETYLKMYPDTVAPAAPKRKKHRKTSPAESIEKNVTTEDKGIGTESRQSLEASSIVMAKKWSHQFALRSLSKITREQLKPPTPVTSEEMMYTENFEEPSQIRKQVTIQSISKMRGHMNAQSMKSVIQLSTTNNEEGKSKKTLFSSTVIEHALSTQEEELIELK